MTAAAPLPVIVDPDKLKRDGERVRRDFWRKLRRNARRMPFLADAVAAYYAATDRTTPLQVKGVLLGALAYFVVPADMMPDFLPLLGFTDDAAVLYAAIRTIAPHIKPEHHARAEAALARLAEPHEPEGGKTAR